jgi:hypothetical protein
MHDGNTAAERQYAADQARAVRDSDPFLQDALDDLVERVMSGGRVCSGFLTFTLDGLREDHPAADDAELERHLRARLEDSDALFDRAAELAGEPE